MLNTSVDLEGLIFAFTINGGGVFIYQLLQYLSNFYSYSQIDRQNLDKYLIYIPSHIYLLLYFFHTITAILMRNPQYLVQLGYCLSVETCLNSFIVFIFFDIAEFAFDLLYYLNGIKPNDPIYYQDYLFGRIGLHTANLVIHLQRFF